MQPYSRLIKKKRAGDPVLAKDWNLIVDLLARTPTQPGIYEFAHGIALIPPRGGGGPSAPTKIGKVTAKAGTDPPFLYTGYEVELTTGDGTDPDDYTQLSGGDEFDWDLLNVQEIGDSGIGVAPLEVGAIVFYTAFGDGFRCTASNYRGSFPLP